MLRICCLTSLDLHNDIANIAAYFLYAKQTSKCLMFTNSCDFSQFQNKVAHRETKIEGLSNLSIGTLVNEGARIETLAI